MLRGNRVHAVGWRQPPHQEVKSASRAAQEEAEMGVVEGGAPVPVITQWSRSKGSLLLTAVGRGGVGWRPEFEGGN